jgi:hypothetical protein
MDFEYEPDPLDVASRLEAAERDACVAAARNQPAMQATGFCREPRCQAPLPEKQLFCGEECRDYYEKTQRMKRITGKA